MDIIEIFTAPVIVESTTTSTQVVEVNAVAPVIEIFTTPVILETTTTPSQIVEVVTEGPQGPPGDGGGDINFVYSQNTPQSQWVIVHNLGKFPSVSVVDSAQTHVEGDVQYDSVNQLTLSFASGFSGKAILN
jgi:hypothetical protein